MSPEASTDPAPENHFINRIGWLRAAVLGANDGIVSTASLITGVASAGIAQGEIVVAATAGLVAGAMSMAAGEYVSVSSQSDSERADLARERQELLEQPEFELEELAQIYVERGLEPQLAHTVATQLMDKDALAAHSRDELGITEGLQARPIQAALSSAAAFSIGASLPVAAVLLSPFALVSPITIGTSLTALGFLGVLSASGGGARVGRAVLRVTTCGALAMAATAAVGYLFNTNVS